ncbi:MAG: GTPase ObgE [Opitutales bacterium]
MFIDEITVHLKAGNGGDGCLSFRREAFEPRGGPNGGNGGRGGDVVLVGDENVSDLTAYKFQPKVRAGNGQPGRGSDQTGAGGKPARVMLPLGTAVYAEEGDEAVSEILEHGQEITLLHGGRGGLGNAAFKSSVNQTPRIATAGKPGEEGAFRLVLKTIADVGLVGYPNAGKSSLIGEVSASKAKVGHYPFTTIHPNVGIVEFPEHFERFTMADVPGLIEGASENRGLGHRFLKHLERCRLMLYVLDMAGTEGRDPLEDFASLRKEMAAYQEDLVDRPSVIAANKMDEPGAQENLERLRKKFGQLKTFPISCLSDEGLPELLEHLRRAVRELERPN